VERMTELDMPEPMGFRRVLVITTQSVVAAAALIAAQQVKTDWEITAVLAAAALLVTAWPEAQAQVVKAMTAERL
jgi:hypothetical protein